MTRLLLLLRDGVLWLQFAFRLSFLKVGLELCVFGHLLLGEGIMHVAKILISIFVLIDYVLNIIMLERILLRRSGI